MKAIRLFLICTLINIMFFVFGGFYFFATNLENPVNSTASLPFEKLYMYQLFNNGEVSINIINIFIYSVLIAIPVYILLKLLSQLVTKKLINKGNL